MTADSLPRTDRWTRIHAEFLACHATRPNVAIHLVSTPLGLWAALSLAAGVHPYLPIAIGVLAVAGSSLILPAGLAVVHSVVVVGLVAASLAWTPPLAWLVAALIAAYALQDCAHRVSDEPPYDASYRGHPSAGWRRVEHVLLLLPLVLSAVPRARGPLLAGLVPRRSVLTTTLESESEREALRVLRRWVESRNPPAGQTTHWWVRELDERARASYADVSGSSTIASMFRARHGSRARIRPVAGMDEIYVAGPDREESSDRVFYLPHIDGPLAVYPGATLYRCMVALSPNRRIRTSFPLERDGDGDVGIILDEAGAVAFDYHRTPHYISTICDAPAPVPRINLKLHYVVSSPELASWADALSSLSEWYNARARALFLDTLTPHRMRDRLVARSIVWQTRVWQQISRRIGHRNLAFVAVLVAISFAMGRAWPLVVFGSFVHYLLYIATYSSRQSVSFGAFKRDAIFYKTLSLATLGGLYLVHFEFDPVSLALVACGFGTAALATDALGVDRAYFGAELGVCRPSRIERFPYGAIPHPMILGSIVGLIGVGALEPLRRAWPWLIPLHIAFYLAHLFQEIFDLHDGRDRSGPGAAELAP